MNADITNELPAIHTPPPPALRTPMTPVKTATLDDLRRRIRELAAVQAALLPDADCVTVVSELTIITAQLDAARRELSAFCDEHRSSR